MSTPTPTALPSASQAILDALDDARRAAHGALLAASDATADCRAALRDLRDERARQSAVTSPDRVVLARIDAAIAAATDLLARREAARQRADEVFQTTSAPHARAVNFLSEHAGVHWRHAPGKPPSKGGLGELRAAIDRARDDLLALAVEQAEAEAAPAPSADLIGQAHRAVDALSRPPELDPRVRGGDPFRLASHTRLELIGGAAIVGDAGRAFLTWAIADILKAKLAEIIGPDRPGALSDDERARRLADIAAHKLETERAECAALRAAGELGLAVPFRDDADPRAILEVEAAR